MQSTFSHSEGASRPSGPIATPAVEVFVAATGAALLIAVMLANQTWLDRHFLPSFFVPRHWYVRIEWTVRGCLGVVGIGLLLGRRRVAHIVTDSTGTTRRVVIAAALALAASELALKALRLGPTEWLVTDEEPRRLRDPELGWVLAPDRVGRSVVGRRPIEYAVDSAGYRVRRLDEPVNTDRPTLIFAGESVMFGEGLTWEESIPAQTAARLGIQSANLAVHGYSTDQMYLRLARELPHFRQPVAVVAIFMTELFGRNLDDDRPHLAPGLVWRPATKSSGLTALASLLVPYRREQTVTMGAAVTSEALRAMVQLAIQRHAVPLVVIPQFGPEDEARRAVRVRVVTDDIPHVTVGLDADWRLPWDRHPNARAARAIATAVAERLRRP